MQPPPPERSVLPPPPDLRPSVPGQDESTENDAPLAWDPVQPETRRPSFWSRLGALRGWILGGIAAFYLFGQCSGSGTALDDLDIGDCFEDPGLESEVSSVDIFECDEVHDFELFATVDLGPRGRVYPGENQLLNEMENACIERFAAYVGHDYFTSAYDFVSFTPVQDGWEDGDRLGMCALYEFGADFETIKTIGSGRNSGR